jgi:hypothetical protein
MLSYGINTLNWLSRKMEIAEEILEEILPDVIPAYRQLRTGYSIASNAAGYLGKYMSGVKRKRKTKVGKSRKMARTTSGRRAGGAAGRRLPANLRSFTPEKKYIDCGIGATAGPGLALSLNTSGSIYLLNGIQTGAGVYNRLGRKISMISLNLRVYVNVINQTLTSQDSIGRLMVLYDRQPNGGTPIFSDILQNTDQSDNTYSSSICGLNLNNRERFTVLMDQELYMPPMVVSGGVPQANWAMWPTPNKGCLLSRFIKLKGLVTQYKSDSVPSLAADIATGAIWAFSMSGLTAGLETLNLYWSSRLRYIDQ